MPGPVELLIVLAVAVLLFGGSRLAGLGKGMGRSIREFREEVKTSGGDDAAQVADGQSNVIDAEVVEDAPSKTQAERDLEARERALAEREAELRRRESDS